MPLPNQQQSWADINRLFANPDIPKDIFGSPKENLAHEIAELRLEIAALRAELAPVPSLIVTGQQALDEFKN
ncbi:MAG: hypothetical protein IPK63_16105 [Candidatus Competibacteraceae bacterium]|nr:hypothetical protein [Candidatus Competibacteraceae bacterium]